MKKKCRVIMLPTDKSSKLELGLEGGYLYLNRKSPAEAYEAAIEYTLNKLI